MCIGCYRNKYGRANIITPLTIAAAKSIDGVYEWSPSGGDAHIVVDDWNLENGHIQWCIEHAADKCDIARQAALDCLNMLMQLSVPERTSAMAIHKGFLKPKAAGQSPVKLAEKKNEKGT